MTWRQGRCLPYGDGVTFWALAEIIKGHAGILESDDRETVEAKLEQVLPEDDGSALVPPATRPLLGLDAVKAEREENFTAWLRFLEDMASRKPPSSSSRTSTGPTTLSSTSSSSWHST